MLERRKTSPLYQTEDDGVDQAGIGAGTGGVQRVPPSPPSVPSINPDDINLPGGPGGQTGNPTGPRDRPDTNPGTSNAPGGVQRVGLPGSAPSMPSAPSPISAGLPQPFTPMAPPRGIAGSALAPSSNLLGKAGGLLSGGLGVPGRMGSDAQDISGLIQMLLQKFRG